jgi:hypothetical protein
MRMAARFQFTLQHFLLGVALLSALFASIAWAGLLGFVLYCGACGMALLLASAVNRDGHYLVLGIVLTLTSFAVIGPVSTVDVGDGRSMISCPFVIVDAESGSPIQSAAVRIRDVSSHGRPEGQPVFPIPAGEPGASGDTDREGRVSIRFEFPNTSRSNAFMSKVHVYFSPYHWIQVDATGYDRRLVPLETMTGRSYDWHELPLPEMRIELTRSRTNGG